MATAPRVSVHPIDWGLEPQDAENPRALRILATLEAGVPLAVNIERQVSGETLSNIQNIYIDNKDGANPVSIACGASGQNLTIPANSQAYLPFMFQTGDFVFTITRADAGVLPLFLANMPFPHGVWSTVAAGSVVTLAGGVLTSITDPVDVVVDDSTPIDVAITNASLAVTEADGANAALGATTDAAVTNPATDATAIAFIRGLLTQAGTALTNWTTLLAALPASLGQKAMAASLAVVIASDQSTLNVRQQCATGTLSQVTGTGADIQVLASNANRRGATINNISGVTVSIVFSSTAATAGNASVTMLAGDYCEIPAGYTGEIRGIWASGNIAITELT